jgi:hypothetical protein
MNATALVLPSWTAEVQGYSRQVVFYTPIIWGAFKKTIAPVIIDLLQGVALHCIERERLWRQWTMDIAGITHNPLQAAFDAAHAELTSVVSQAQPEASRASLGQRLAPAKQLSSRRGRGRERLFEKVY